MEPGCGGGGGGAVGAGSRFLNFLQQGSQVLAKAANAARSRGSGGLRWVEIHKSKPLNF